MAIATQNSGACMRVKPKLQRCIHHFYCNRKGRKSATLPRVSTSSCYRRTTSETYLKYLLSFLFPVGVATKALEVDRLIFKTAVVSDLGQPWLLLRREILLIMKKIQRFIDFLTWCLQMREHGRVDSHFQLKTKVNPALRLFFSFLFSSSF